MSEPPHLPSAFGLEAVEWKPRDADTIVVRITGRWRRRRPIGGQPLLVVERDGRRARFPAMPEPPGLTGAAPGTWQMTFSIPAALAEGAELRAWLQLGSVVVPLPAPATAAASGAASTGPASTPADPGRLTSTHPDLSGPRPDAEPPHAPGPAAPEGDDLPATAPEPQAPEVPLLSERRLRAAELALESARDTVRAAEEHSRELQSRLEELERELEQARETASERDAARRRAEQQAFAESARREELQEELNRVGRETPRPADEELKAARAQVRDLEEEVDELQRRLDEAEQAAAAAEAGRIQARRELTQAIAAAPAPSATSGGPQRSRLASERRLAARTDAQPAVASVARARRPDAEPFPQALGLERRLIAAGGRPIAADPVRASISAEPVSVKAVAAKAVAAKSVAAKSVPAEPDPRLPLVLTALRAELGELRALAQRERDARAAAQQQAQELAEQLRVSQQRSRMAFEAIEGLRTELRALQQEVADRAPAQPQPRPETPVQPQQQPELQSQQQQRPESQSQPRSTVDPARLDQALTRLREAETKAPGPPTQGAQAPGEAQQQPRRAWLLGAFRRLASQDPVSAGRLLVALLPAQGLVHPGPLRFDLILGTTDCLQVSVPGEGAPAEVVRLDIPRPPGGVDFTVAGDLRAVGRLLAAGRVPRLRRSRGRVRGNRSAVGALFDLLRRPLPLVDLLGAGARLDPWLAASLVARMVDPAWTRGYSFTVAVQPGADAAGGGGAGALLHVSDGRPVTVAPEVVTAAEPSSERTTPEVLLGLGAPSGEQSHLAQLRVWIERAQSG